MDMFSPLRSNYMEDIKLNELIQEEREARLCDAKIKLGQYIALQNALFEEIFEEETKSLLIEKRRRKLQTLKNARTSLSI